MTRQTIATGSRYEELMGYSRAVLAQGTIYVSGCSGLPPDIDTAGPGDAAAQLAYAVTKVSRILEQAGATLADVVRTRLYLTDDADWDALIAAHGRAFGAVRPACTMVQVSRLIDTRMKIELEVTAIAGVSAE
ncbi:RidA family protein [Acidisoma cellulosilytica]|uniref:RidA family protein n=1 Tax=Acidisoma cellulosilyticum TaxID=2802395 RepID=A0A963Z4S7_9PROT|nr:RidA family protein [Acidisoma cellulosilyticum]MCB8881907.1 RidA family protein [Acidisoma cellulosilyticum]